MYYVSLEAIVYTPFNYLFVIYLLRDIMTGRSPFKLQKQLAIYNISQIILNLYMIYGLAELVDFSSFVGLFGLNKKYNDNLKYYVYIHYLSKYFDYLDTFFIVLRGKSSQLSFLHVYHHATIGMVWGFLILMGHGNGTAAFGCLINSFIHTIMYSHYLITSFGYKNPFKKLITQAQMIQFLICLVHSILVIKYERIVPTELSYIQFFYHIQMISLFNNFYRKSYNYKKLN